MWDTGRYYEKNFCAHPQVIRYGGRKRFCKQCNSFFRIRPKKRGRKCKRQSEHLAEKILRVQATLRGTAESNKQGKGLVIGRFHRSILAWKRTHPPAPPFTARSGFLIGIFDGVWFRFGKERYVCLVLLVRPVKSQIARLRGLLLIQGDESEEHWKRALHTCLTPQELTHIQAIVADGAHGLVSLCKEYGWKYQRCHFHILKDLQAISGKRSGPTQKIRKKALALVREILDTPSEQMIRPLKARLHRLVARSDCPKTVRKKVGGFLTHLDKFRTCYQYPALNLPHTSNTAECAGRIIRARLGIMRGLRTLSSLRYWLDIILRSHPDIRCEKKQFTNQIKRT